MSLVFGGDGKRNPLLSPQAMWFWLSFVDPSMHGRKGWLGVVCVKAPTVEAAIAFAQMAQLTPTGSAWECAGADVPAQWGDPPEELERLVTDTAKLERLAIEWFGVGEHSRVGTTRQIERETGKRFWKDRDDGE